MPPTVPTDASPGFATSVLFQDPSANSANYLNATERYLAALGSDPSPDTTPTAENMLKAKVLLLDYLLDSFPFADVSDRAHALAMVLQPLARPLILGPTPLHVLSGVRGIGKTTLLEAAVLPYRRAEVVNSFGVHGEHEWQRVIRAGLSRYPSHFFIRGQASPLSSPAVAQALTADNFYGRLLHRPATATFPIRCTWAFASEEPKLSPDIAIRAVHIRLSRQNRAVKFRQFEAQAFPDDQLFAAALTLVRGWLEAGQPRCMDKSSRFTEWSQIIGGILEVAGVPGFLHDQG